MKGLVCNANEYSYTENEYIYSSGSKYRGQLHYTKRPPVSSSFVVGSMVCLLFSQF